MNHATPSHWETSHRPMSGLTAGNACKALEFLSSHMNCNDDIHYMLLTYGIPTCNNPEVVEDFLEAHHEWLKCGCIVKEFKIINLRRMLNENAKERIEHDQEPMGTPLKEIIKK